MKEKPVCQSGPIWLKNVASTFPTRIGLQQPSKSPLAPLTGQDYQAYRTFLHALELYGYCDTEGHKHALACMRHAVSAMQPHTQWIARATIPHLLDWSDQHSLWPQIIGGSGGCVPEAVQEKIVAAVEYGPATIHERVERIQK